MINDYHVLAMELCHPARSWITIAATPSRSTTSSTRTSKSVDIELVDFKLEFGKLRDGTIVLADEISPDTCRFWDATNRRKAGQGPLPPRPWRSMEAA